MKTSIFFSQRKVSLCQPENMPFLCLNNAIYADKIFKQESSPSYVYVTTVQFSQLYVQPNLL